MEVNWLDKFSKEQVCGRCKTTLQACFVIIGETNAATKGQLALACPKCTPALQLLDEIIR